MEDLSKIIRDHESHIDVKLKKIDDFNETNKDLKSKAETLKHA